MDTVIFDGGIAICKRDKPYIDSPEEEYQIDSLCAYLNCPVEIKPGTTLRHVWQYLEKDAPFFNMVFMQALGKYDLDIYIQQSKKTPKTNEDEDPDNSMDSLEAYWDAEVYEGQLQIFPSFHGRGKYKYTDADGKEVVTDSGWAVEFTPVNDLLDYPLVLDPKMQIEEDDKDRKTIWSGEREWTVYDMYYAILYEISFVGTPENQLKVMADIDQRVAEARDSLEEKDVLHRGPMP